MFFDWWRKAVRVESRVSRRERRKPPHVRRATFKPRAEVLEDRLAPATLTVNTTADAVNPADGTLSLRDAIAAINAGKANGLTAGETGQVTGPFGSNDTIQFAIPTTEPGYNPATGAYTITLGSTLPALSSNVAIVGPGATSLSVSGAGRYQILAVNAGVTASVSGMTLENSYSTDPGAAVSNAGTLAISDSVFVNNKYIPGLDAIMGGGAIYNAGSLVIDSSTFSDNHEFIETYGSGPGEGGAIDNDGSLTVSNSAFTNNTADSGGAIANQGLMTISASSLLNNGAFVGGAVNNGGTATVSNSIIAGNSANYGGGIDSSGGLTVSNSTVINNNSFGGVTGNVTSVDSVIAGNEATLYGGALQESDVGYGVMSLGYNLVGDLSYGFGVIGDQAGVGPSFGKRAVDTGGPTTTLVGPVDSAATTLAVADAATIASTPGRYVILVDSEQMLVTDVDLVNNTLSVQRGFNGTTPASHDNGTAVYPATDLNGAPRVVNGRIDIGAVENQSVQSSPVALTAPMKSLPQPVGMPDSIDLGSFSDADGSAGPWLVTVSWGDATAAPAFTTSTPGALGSMSHLYPGAGVYAVTVTVSDANGEVGQAIFYVDISRPITSADLQAYLATANALTIPASTYNTPGSITQVVNGLTNIAQPVSITLDLGGGTYSTGGLVYAPGDSSTAQNVTYVIQNGTFDNTQSAPTLPTLTVADGNVTVQNCTLNAVGDEPALVVDAGQVSALNSTLTTAGNVSGIQVNGGALTLGNDTIQQYSRNGGEVAVLVNGGTADLGTIDSPGYNAFDVSAGNGFVQYAKGTTPVIPAGDSFEVNGADPPAVSQPFVVTTTQDNGNDGNPLAGSLRQAISQATFYGIANGVAPGVTFSLSPNDPGYNQATGLYTISLTQQLTIAYALSVNGPGEAQLALDGGSSTRVLEVASGNTVSLSGLTIQNGYAASDSGGGILAIGGGTLTVSDCVFSQNSADGSGGGISAWGTTLTVSNCDFSNNKAGGFATSGEGGAIAGTLMTVSNSRFSDNSAGSGGAIEGVDSLITDSSFIDNSAQYTGGAIDNSNFGRVTVLDSTLSGNTAGFAGGAIAGYGYSDVSLIVSGSTFVNNSAVGEGGAIFFSDANDYEGFGNSSMTVSNSTLFGDSADYYGGGIFIAALGSSSTLTNTTITGNRGNVSGGGIFGDGLALNNSIVADNYSGPSPSTTPNDINGGWMTGAFNLVGTGGSSGLQNGVDGNQVGVDPGLDPNGLQDNGGPTQTIALLSGSPAIGAGSVALAVDASGNPLLTDQRGFGFLRTVNGAVDIGAYQTQPSITSRDYLETVVSGTLLVDPNTGNPTATLSLSSQDQANAFLSVLSSSNMNPLTVPSGSATPIDLAVSLAGGVQLTEADLTIPAGFRVSINGGTWLGGSPALTLESGSLTVSGATFQNATDAPTILVKGGSLTLRNDNIQESTGFTDAAIRITGGTVDLGTTDDPGGNSLNVNGAGEFVQNDTAGLIPAVGDTFTADGKALAASTLSFTSVSASAATTVLNQPLTLTATVRPDGAGMPSGSVDFVDTTTHTDLGSVALSGGTATLTTMALTAGNHVLQARYSGDGTFLPSLDTTTVSVHYRFSGFLAPLNSNLAMALNRTVPIKFQLSDYKGNALTSLSAVASLQVLNAQGANVLTNAGSTALRYDPTANQFAANWQTKGLPAGTYTVQLKLADGTTQTKTVRLTASGGSSGLETGAAGSTAASGPGGLLGGDIELYVDNSNGDLTTDELARIQDAVTAVDAITEPYGVTVTEVTDPAQADVTLNMDSTSAVGGYADGVLGCTTDAGQITVIAGWDFYAGGDATQIGPGQYDFQTVVTHELGHALGLGHSTDSTSVMYATLDTGSAKRSLTTADLNVPDTDTTGACGLRAAPLLPAASGVNPPGGDEAAPGGSVLRAVEETPPKVVVPLRQSDAASPQQASLAEALRAPGRTQDVTDRDLSPTNAAPARPAAVSAVVGGNMQPVPTAGLAQGKQLPAPGAGNPWADSGADLNGPEAASADVRGGRTAAADAFFQALPWGAGEQPRPEAADSAHAGAVLGNLATATGIRSVRESGELPGSVAGNLAAGSPVLFALLSATWGNQAEEAEARRQRRRRQG